MPACPPAPLACPGRGQRGGAMFGRPCASAWGRASTASHSRLRHTAAPHRGDHDPEGRPGRTAAALHPPAAAVGEGWRRAAVAAGAALSTWAFLSVWSFWELRVLLRMCAIMSATSIPSCRPERAATRFDLRRRHRKRAATPWQVSPPSPAAAPRAAASCCAPRTDGC